MQGEELRQALSRQEREVVRLQLEKEAIREQMAIFKQGKYNAEEKIIELSNSIYYLEKKNSPIQYSGKGLPRIGNIITEFSALTEDDRDHQNNMQLEGVAKFKLTKLIGNEEGDLCLSEDESERPELKEKSPNLPFGGR